jgi:hypothetical protein
MQVKTQDEMMNEKVELWPLTLSGVHLLEQVGHLPVFAVNSEMQL